MTSIKKQAAALKHGAFSAMTILPGESAAEFEKLHQEVISELTSNGAIEANIIATIAGLLWRRKHLSTFRIAELVQQRMKQIQAAMVPDIDPDIDNGEPKTTESVEFEKTFIEKWQAAEGQARKELGELYALVEMGDEVTIDRLLEHLNLLERLDAMIDKCLKRLLFVRGVKSLSPAPTSVPRVRLSGPSKAA